MALGVEVERVLAGRILALALQQALRIALHALEHLDALVQHDLDEGQRLARALVDEPQPHARARIVAGRTVRGSLRARAAAFELRRGSGGARGLGRALRRGRCIRRHARLGWMDRRPRGEQREHADPGGEEDEDENSLQELRHGGCAVRTI